MLFLLLEGIALALFINHNNYPRTKYLHSANWISGNIYVTYNSVIKYFHLSRVNKELSEENARLRTFVENIKEDDFAGDSSEFFSAELDTTFYFFPARVINNSVNRPFNYFTLNKGRKDGVRPDQGVISGNGIVGVVTNVSESFAVGLSVLNRRWSVSAMLGKSGNFGSLVWRETNYKEASLTEIPLHVDVSVGDTVITSGYSAIFPKGIMVGTIRNIARPPGENYYALKVQLSTDFKALEYVEVIENLNRPEIYELEKIIRDDPLAN